MSDTGSMKVNEINYRYVTANLQGEITQLRADIKVLAEAVLDSHKAYSDCPDCQYLDDCEMDRGCPEVICQCIACQTARKYVGGEK